jgi:hypothetical protein
MSGYEELARQLRASVRELGVLDGARPPRWRRGRRRGLLVVLAALVVGGGVATAAQTGVLRLAHDDHPMSAREVARAAVTEARGLPACRPLDDGAGARTQAIAPSPVAAPLLVAPSDPSTTAAVLRFNHGGPVVEGSARRIVFPDGAVVLLWVAVGGGAGSFADPAACAEARLAALARDRPDPGSRLRQKAEVILRGSRDTLPGLQTLWVMRRRGGPGGGSGTGIPLDGRALPVGVVAGGSDGRYLGLAAAGAVRVSVDGRDLHRSFAVAGHVFAVSLPDGTGPVRLRQRAADGRVVAAQTLRG